MYKNARQAPKNGWHHKADLAAYRDPVLYQEMIEKAYKAEDRAKAQRRIAQQEQQIKAKLQAEQLAKAAKPAGDPWLLTVVGVPDRLVALVNRLGLQQNKKKTCWWSLFEVNDSERFRARKIQRALKEAALSFHWKQSPRKPTLSPSWQKARQHQRRKSHRK